MNTSETFNKRDRRALWLLAVEFFVNGAVFASFVPRFPEVRDRIGVSLETLGLLITLAIGLGLIGSVIASRAIDF